MSTKKSIKKNIKTVQKFKYNKYAVDDEVMGSPLTDKEKELIDKTFPSASPFADANKEKGYTGEVKFSVTISDGKLF